MNWRWRRTIYLASTFIEAVSVTLVNRFRRVLGVQPARHPTHQFLHIFLLSMLGRMPALRLTCSERSDGAGAQAHTIMAAISFARASGGTYLHTPFCEIAHADRPMDEWVLAWEMLFNFGAGGRVDESTVPRIVNFSAFHPRFYHILLNTVTDIRGHIRAVVRGATYRRDHFHPFLFFADAHPEAYRDVIPELRRWYYQDKMPVRNPVLTVAVHVRRGDVTVQHHRRYTPVAKVIRTAEQILNTMKRSGKEVRMILHSEGCADEFVVLQELGVELNLNGDAIATFRDLVEADILIMSKSSFSYVAALLSDGLILYEPFWHSPMSDWVCLDRNGSFDESDFRQVFERIVVGCFHQGSPV